MRARELLLASVSRTVRLAAAVLLSLMLFSILPFVHRLTTQTAGLSAAEARQTDIEIRPRERKREQRQQSRPMRRSAEARPSAGSRDRGLDFRFTPDLAVGGEGAGVGVQHVETMVFEEGQTDEPAVPLSRPMPPYPPRARTEGIEGTVEIEIVVNREGRVVDIAFRSLPSPVFRSTVVSTVKKWRFKPARHKGVPVSMRFRVPIEFRLGG